MSHVRKQLRDAVISALKENLTALGGRVDKVRGFSRNLDRLPSAEVSTPGEQTTGETTDGLIVRNVELTVTLLVAGDVVEDQCDALAAQAEAAIYQDTTIMGLVQDITPESMSFEMQGDAEKRVARMELSWAAIIATLEADPQTAI